MQSVAAALWFVLLTGPIAGPVDRSGTDEVAPRPFEVNASVSGGTAAVLPGVALGVTAELQRRRAANPLFVAARLQWTASSGATESWVINHDQFVAAVGAGLTTTVGAGRVWAEVGGGASGLREVLNRQELQRMQAAGVTGSTESSFTVGPYGFGELGAGLTLRGWFRGLVAAGPTVTWTTVDGSGLVRWGALARVGLAYDF
jgi:hypothetical protein